MEAYSVFVSTNEKYFFFSAIVAITYRSVWISSFVACTALPAVSLLSAIQFVAFSGRISTLRPWQYSELIDLESLLHSLTSIFELIRSRHFQENGWWRVRREVQVAHVIAIKYEKSEEGGAKFEWYSSLIAGNWLELCAKLYKAFQAKRIRWNFPSVYLSRFWRAGGHTPRNLSFAVICWPGSPSLYLWVKLRNKIFWRQKRATPWEWKRGCGQLDILISSSDSR